MASDDLTHLTPDGRLKMVDVSDKPATLRHAAASAVVEVGPAVLELLRDRRVGKGDVLAAARIAGIMAAKKTGELIPLCHALAPEHLDVQIELAPPGQVRIRAAARIVARTGVEMEAMTAAAVAALTIYDMCKSADKQISIGSIRLEEKSGGKSGAWRRSQA